MVTFLDYYPVTKLVSMTLFLLGQMINEVDSVFLQEGSGVTGTLVLTTPKASVSEASLAGLLCPNNQEATYL